VWLAADLCSAPGPLPADGASVRVLVFNVHTESSSFAEARRLIEDTRPDVIGLVEVDRRWLAALAPVLTGYAGRLESPRSDNFGVALYTRRPLSGSIERFASELPSAVAQLAFGGAELAIVLIHPPPPVSSRALAAQIDQLDAVAERVRQLRGPAVVMGDYNATPWSQPFAAWSPAAACATAAPGKASPPATLPRRRRCGFRSTTRSSHARSGWRIAASSATSARIISR
jgi:endonuclease/exonuclease/phosphatase (EEP) superfamily protein YafD